MWYHLFMLENWRLILVLFTGILLLGAILRKWQNRVVLITHSGLYHLDDLLATVILIKFLKEKGQWYQIIRTRDEKKIDRWRRKRNLDRRNIYIYDVGKIYDESKNEFDHHQIGGAGKRENGIEYSSAGLIWKKIGLSLVKNDKNIWDEIDRKFIQPIDALDNGQEICDYKYDIKLFDLSEIVKLNLSKKQTDFWMNISFRKNIRLIKKILNKKINFEFKKEESRLKLMEIYKNSTNKKFLVIDDETVDVSLITDLFPDVLFVVHFDGKDKWFLKTIRKKNLNFERRMLFPEEWAGLDGYDLDHVTEVIGGVFCHRGRFLAAAKTKDAAIKMVKKVLDIKK